ncbi:hypothetical protein ACLQ3B_24390 [Micromonospora sp. DT53]|uniref:hypothetical protein n=1 Tax=Micromonospora sp. DT53 TaxID=3393444 RepID=UPI003CF80C90
MYAIGDVNRRALLTHAGKYQARVVGNVLAARAADRPLDTTAWGRIRPPPATIAVAAQVPIERPWHAVPSFPTISEVWLRLLEVHRG